MKRGDLPDTVMVISNWNKTFGLHGLYKSNSAVIAKHQDGGFMLGHRLRGCANIKPALGKCVVLAGR